MPRGIKTQKAIKEDREINVFYNEEIPDQPLPEITNLEELKYQGGKLKDLNLDEGRKLTDSFNRAKAGLTAEGFVQKVIRGANITGTPTVGLNMTNQYIGYYNGTTWPVYIANNGLFMFQGDSGNYITWNGSVLNIRGQLNADDIVAGTLTGRTVQTANSGARVVIETEGEDANSISFYGSDGYPKLSIFEDIIAWETNPWIISTSTDILEIRFPIPIADIRSLFFTRGTRADVKIYGSPGTAIEVPSLIPSGDNDLGSYYYKWRNLYLSGTILADTVNAAGMRVYYGNTTYIDIGYTNFHDILPREDGYGQLGYRAGYGGQIVNRRWSNIHGVTIVSGDFVFENKFRITEEGDNALAIYNQRNEKILIIDEEGNINKVNT